MSRLMRWSCAVALAVLFPACDDSSEVCADFDLDDPVKEDVRLRATVTDAAGDPVSNLPISLEGFKEHCAGRVESFGPFDGLTDSTGVFEPGLTLTLEMDNGRDVFRLAAYEPSLVEKLGEVTFGVGNVRGQSTLNVPVTLSE